MTWKSTVLSVCGTLMPDLYRPPAGVLFPCAHIVADIAPPHVKHLYRVPSIAKFKADIEFLCRRYQPLQLSDLERLPHRRRRNGSARFFVLSFDDGMRESYEVIAPILREKGIPAVFFINSKTVDNRQLMWRHKVSLLADRLQQDSSDIPSQLGIGAGECVVAKLHALHSGDEQILDDIANSVGLDFEDYLRNTKPYLTSGQVLELAQAGFEFGAHSESHPCFEEIAVDDQKQQIAGSVRFIRELGLPCRSFAFPFHDKGVPNSVFRYMTELNVILSFGTSEARLDSVPFSFQRFGLDAENADLSVRDLLKLLSAKSLVRRLTRTELIRRN